MSHSECAVCSWRSKEWPTQDQAGCDATWHVFEQHPNVWQSMFGNTAPRDPLPETLAAVVDHLSDVYTPEGVDIWLRAPNQALGGRRPVDAVRRGDTATVLQLIERLAGGPR